MMCTSGRTKCATVTVVKLKVVRVHTLFSEDVYDKSYVAVLLHTLTIGTLSLHQIASISVARDQAPAHLRLYSRWQLH